MREDSLLPYYRDVQQDTCTSRLVFLEEIGLCLERATPLGRQSLFPAGSCGVDQTGSGGYFSFYQNFDSSATVSTCIPNQNIYPQKCGNMGNIYTVLILLVHPFSHKMSRKPTFTYFNMYFYLLPNIQQ